jgi:hypothetical protein
MSVWTATTQTTVDHVCPCGSDKAHMFIEIRSAPSAGGGAASLVLESRRQFRCLACGVDVVEA